MFIKKYLILLLTICITFICIQDSQSQSGRRLWGSDAYIEGDFQSNNIYAEDNISSTTGTFNVLEVDYPFDFKFYIQDLQPIVRVGNSLFLDLADDLIIGNSQSIRFYPHVEGTKIDLFDNTYTIGLEPYTFIFETDEDFEFRTDEGNTIFKILADGTILSGSIITSSSVTIGDGYTLDFEQGTLGNKINLYGNSYNIGVIPYTLVLETDRNILMKNDTGKTLSYFSETEGMLTDKISTEILNVTGSAVITSVTAGVIDSTTASIQYINDATTDSTILYGHASQTVGSGVYSDISTLENIGIENLSSQGYPIGLALDVGSASTWYETDFVMGMFTCANLGKGICLAANGSHIFRSTDYGLTWSVVDDGLYVHYKAVCYLGNGVCLMSACDRGAIIFRSEDYGLTWSISSDEYTGYDSFKQIEYLGDGVCLAVGDNIIRSIDNGLTWSTVYEWVDLFSICNLGNGICLVSVDDYEGWMLRSEDYGQTWSLKGPYLSSLGVNYINSFAYLGNGICLAGTAGGGKILRSTDYGQTWSICTTFSEQNSIQSIVYLGNGICLTSGYTYGNTAAILRSTDYGLTWQDFGYHFGASSITSMCSIGDGICLAAKHPGDTLLRSTLTISASSWTLSGDSTDIYFNEGNVGIGTAAPTKKLHVEGDIDATTLSVTSLSATTGILSTANAQTLNVTGNATISNTVYSTTTVAEYINDSITDTSILSGNISRTVGANIYSDLADLQTVSSEDYFYNGVSTGLANDIGSVSTWSDLGQQYSQKRIYSLAYLGNGIVLAGAYPSGKILRSTDYGLTWSDLGQQYSQTRIFSFAYLGNGIVLAGTGDNGKILRSTDYGLTWSDLGQQYSQTSIPSLTYLGNGIVLAGTGETTGKILRSTDYGLTWSDLGRQYSQTCIYSLAYLGNGIVLAGTHPNGKILRSTDYGLTWSDLGQQYSQEQIRSLAYLGNGIALAGTGETGKILRSTDYGLTWSDLGQQYSQSRIYSLAYLGNGIVLAGTSSSGKILRSTDYGLTWSDLGQQYSQTYIYSLAYLGNGIVLAGTYPSGKILRSSIYDIASKWTLDGDSTNLYYNNGNVGIGTTAPTKKLHVEGDIYALGDISAATFTDRTPAPPEDSLSQILKVSSKNGEIDHDTLGAAKVKRVQKISYVNVYSATDNSLIVKIPTTLNENIINITEEVPEQIVSATEAIEIVTKEIPVLYDLDVTEVVKEITAPHSTVIKPEKIIKYKEKHYIKDMEKPLAVDDQYLEEDIYIDNAGDINFVVFPDAPAVETKDVVKKVTRTITLPSGEEIVETTTQEIIQLKPNVVQENDVYRIPSYTKVIGQRNLIKEKIEQEYNIPQEEIILQEQEVIEEVGSRDIGMSVSMSIRSIQQLYNLVENLTNRIKILEENK